MEASALSDSVRGYLHRDSAKGAALRATLAELLRPCPDTVIFGGLLREFALGKAETFASDIDLVTFVSRRDLFQAIRHFDPKNNKFGGYRFVVSDQSFDIWAFEDTWAFREGVVQGVAFSDLLKTTFFNLDAAAYHLTTEECWCHDRYTDMVRQGILELNLEKNPHPKRMAMRAIDMALANKLALGPRLATFVLGKLRRAELRPFAVPFWDGLKSHVDRSPDSAYRFRGRTGVGRSP